MRFHKIASILLLLSCCGWAGIILPADYNFASPSVSGSDGSATACGVVGGCTYRPSGTGWAFSGSAGIASDGLFGADPFNLSPPPDGNQAAFIQYNPGNPASSPGNISQDITGLDPSAFYTLSFDAAQRPETDGPGGFLFGGGLDFYVYWCPGVSSCTPGPSNEIYEVKFDNKSPTYVAFAEYNPPVSFTTGGATFGTLGFYAYNTTKGDPALGFTNRDESDFITDVELNGNDGSVPEPSNGLMVLSGITLIGLALGRKLIHNRLLPS